MLHLEQTLAEGMRDEKTEILSQEPMKNHTTFRVGGPAAFYVKPGNEEDLRRLLKICRDTGTKSFLLGNGSNVLVSDHGFDGVVISLDRGWSFCEIQENCLRAGAAVSLGAAARMAREQSLTGMEALAGIPGTVGGALVMNAGAYGAEVKDVLKSAKVMDREGNVLTLSAAELALGYRTSCIPSEGFIVLEAEFALMPGDKEAIGEKMQELAARRREKQPLEYPSAGSTFKRPEGFFAGKLIQDAGLSGFRVGDAQVSEKHCGFVINRGNATASEVMELCRQVRARVKEQFGVELEMEVKPLGKFEGCGG